MRIKTFLVEVVVSTETGPKQQTFTCEAVEDWAAQEAAHDMAISSGFATPDDDVTFGKTTEKFPSVGIKVKRLRPTNNPLPRYMTNSAAGADLLADIDDEIVILPGKRHMVPTGIAMEIPVGFEVQIRPRSGLALRNVTVHFGTLDADYRGEVSVIVINNGDEPFVINPGDRIAQMVVARCWQADWTEVEDLSETTRGTGGFGHTGRDT